MDMHENVRLLAFWCAYACVQKYRTTILHAKTFLHSRFFLNGENALIFNCDKFQINCFWLVVGWQMGYSARIKVLIRWVWKCPAITETMYAHEKQFYWFLLQLFNLSVFVCILHAKNSTIRAFSIEIVGLYRHISQPSFRVRSNFNL